MPTASKTITRPSGATVEISLTRDVVDNNSYADGWNVNLGRKISERQSITIVMPNGKKAWGYRIDKLMRPTDKAYARVGDAFISQDAYDEITAVLAELSDELGKSDEYLAIRQAEADTKARGEENMRRIEAEQAARRQHPGWCEKCQSYCYGDCES